MPEMTETEETVCVSQPSDSRVSVTQSLGRHNDIGRTDETVNDESEIRSQHKIKRTSTKDQSCSNAEPVLPSRERMTLSGDLDLKTVPVSGIEDKGDNGERSCKEDTCAISKIKVIEKEEFTSSTLPESLKGRTVVMATDKNYRSSNTNGETNMSEKDCEENEKSEKSNNVHCALEEDETCFSKGPKVQSTSGHNVESKCLNEQTDKAQGDSTEEVMRFAEILYKCTLCTSLPSILTSKESFISHVSEQHLTRHGFFRECLKCSLRFRTEEDLKAHEIYNHAQSLVPVSPKHTTFTGSDAEREKTISDNNEPELSVDNAESDSHTSIHTKKQEKTVDHCNDQATNQNRELQCENNKQEYSVRNITFKERPGKHTPSSIKTNTGDCSELLDLSKKGTQCPSKDSFHNKQDYSSDNVNNRSTPNSFVKQSPENMARLQFLTDQIVRNNSSYVAVQNKGCPNNGSMLFGFTPSFTAEFGKFTKLVREGGNIVYFCQVCNWKSPVKTSFSVHCNMNSHKIKVKSAEEKDPDTENELPPNTHPMTFQSTMSTSGVNGEGDKRSFREPVSWSPRGGASCLSMLIDSPGFYLDNNARRQPVSNTSNCSRSTSDVVFPFIPVDGKSRVRAPTQLNNSHLLDNRKSGHSLHEFRSNRRKRAAPTSIRNQVRSKRHWSDSDSDSESSSDRNLTDNSNEGDYILQHKKRLFSFDASKCYSRQGDSPSEGTPASPKSWSCENSEVDTSHLKTERVERHSLLTSQSENGAKDTVLPVSKGTSSTSPVNMSELDKKDGGHGGSFLQNTAREPKDSEIFNRTTPIPEPKVYKCYFCAYEYTDITAYRTHFERAHSSGSMTNQTDDNLAGKSGTDSMYPLEMGENWRVQKLKEVLPDFLIASLKGNISREHLLQRISLTLGIPELVGWGSACNKAMREAFPSSMAQRKGKYKKTYFFGVNLVEPPIEKEEAGLSDAESLTYQPLRDMNIDMEKILEYLPSLLQWTGDMERGVSRDEVLSMLGEQMEDCDVRQWGTQCNRAVRLVFPGVDMKRKGKYKTTVFFGVDFRDSFKTHTFIPNKRGRPRKLPSDEPDVTFDPITRSENDREQAESQYKEDPFTMIRKAQAKHWLDSIGSLGILNDTRHQSTKNMEENREPFYRSSLGRSSYFNGGLVLSQPHLQGSIQRWFSQESLVPGLPIMEGYMDKCLMTKRSHTNDNDDDGDDEDEDEIAKENDERTSPENVETGEKNAKSESDKKCKILPEKDPVQETHSEKFELSDQVEGKIENHLTQMTKGGNCPNFEKDLPATVSTNCKKRQHMHDIVESLKEDVS